jgi:hypothetical protein
MDFIAELPKSRNGCDVILVVVDKLTKYALFIPTVGTLSEKETAALFFKHIVTKFGIPRQVISDRDTWWRGVFLEGSVSFDGHEAHAYYLVPPAS